MNKFNLEITYKDIYSVTCNQDPYGTELIVELSNGSIIKARKNDSGIGPLASVDNKAKYDALNKIVTDYLIFAQAITRCHGEFEKTLKEVEAELEKE